MLTGALQLHTMRLSRIFQSASRLPQAFAIRPAQQIRTITQTTQTATNGTSTTTPTSSTPSIPPPIPFVPNVTTFLTLIGRNLKQHASKFPTWESLFTLSSAQLRALGIENARDRRYLLRWRQRYAQGRLGPGGDFAYVDTTSNGGVPSALLKVVEVPVGERGMKKMVVNVPTSPQGEQSQQSKTAEAASQPLPLVRPKGYTVSGAWGVSGPYARPLGKASAPEVDAQTAGLPSDLLLGGAGVGGARVSVAEGMWEDKRGVKKDGGERRRAEVRFKRRVAERRARREAEAQARA